MKHLSKVLIVCAMLLPLLSACDLILFGNKNEIRYLAVKMSDAKESWSIVDTKDGKVLAEDEFSHKPSIIVDEMFYVENDKGLYEFYNVNDVNHNVGGTYKSVTVFGDGRAVVCNEGEGLSIINKDGETVAKLPSSIKAATSFQNGFAAVANEEGKIGFINTDGEFVIKMSYDDLDEPFSEDGYAVVSKKDGNEENTFTYSVIDKKGEKLFSFSSGKYEAVLSGFFNGAIAVKSGDEIVYLDKTGSKILRVGDAQAGTYGFYKDLTIYADGQEYGIKSKDGDKVIKAKYSDIMPVTNGNYLVKKDDKCFIINKDGERLTSDSYETLQMINEDRFLVQTKSGGNFSIIDEKGKEIGNDSYSDVSLSAGTYAMSDEGNEPSSNDDDEEAAVEADSTLVDEVVDSTDDGSMKLTGTVAGSPVVMYLNNDEGDLTGYYYYTKMGPNNALKLSGSLYDDDSIELEEYNSRNGVNSGSFSGYLVDGHMSGDFSNSRGNQYTFNLYVVE